ncbi:MAG: hypothetical protein ACLF0G_06720 [Candidatus Brocadiia bacterium]
MRGRLAVLAIAVACAWGVGGAAALAAEEAAEPRPSHSLSRMFASFSWQAKRRPWYHHVLWYLPSRGADLLDCVGLEIGGGIGMHGNVHLTRYLQLGMGREYSSRAGLMSRYPVVVDREIDETALGWYWDMALARKTLLGHAQDLDIRAREAREGYYKEVDPAGIGVSVFPGAFGASAEVKLHEVVDFALGLFTIDSLGDDY